MKVIIIHYLNFNCKHGHSVYFNTESDVTARYLYRLRHYSEFYFKIFKRILKKIKFSTHCVCYCLKERSFEHIVDICFPSLEVLKTGPFVKACFKTP